ncbi:hypothetical protein Goklo_004729 [Gossypium klotzschianum]|uniref:Uncharacterized protein n=1 Tax=Gossypium klotzschianum TaxID=34286 RepID=A0A7J8VPT6_9ROSI|nr:hypothetical protein [Gossypium klotzschianum]
MLSVFELVVLESIFKLLIP